MKSMKLLVEGFVVLISILLAFYLEGWRHDQELDQKVTQELYSVKQELERNKSQLEAEIFTLGRIITASNHLLNILKNNMDSDNSMVPDSMIWLSNTFSPTFDPSLGAIEALIVSGQLARIKNSELRLGLAGLKDKFKDALEEELVARELTINHQFPLVRNHLDMSKIFPIGMEVFTRDKTGFTMQERTKNQSLPTFGKVSYPNNLALRNVIELKNTWLTTGKEEFTRILSHLNDLILLVEKEISGKN
ncbi:MAG: hypothetical protein FI672_00010 [SAR202 cluster bacterium]|nr:hypothetical protein [SAR202 cluster bacterium]